MHARVVVGALLAAALLVGCDSHRDCQRVGTTIVGRSGPVRLVATTRRDGLTTTFAQQTWVLRTSKPVATSGIGTIVRARRGGSLVLEVATMDGRVLSLDQVIACV